MGLSELRKTNVHSRNGSRPDATAGEHRGRMSDDEDVVGGEWLDW
jgi:hypothetical protein